MAAPHDRVCLSAADRVPDVTAGVVLAIPAKPMHDLAYQRCDGGREVWSR